MRGEYSRKAESRSGGDDEAATDEDDGLQHPIDAAAVASATRLSVRSGLCERDTDRAVLELSRHLHFHRLLQSHGFNSESTTWIVKSYGTTG